MQIYKLTNSLLVAGLTLACGAAQAAETDATTPPKPAARPTTIPPASTKQGVTFATDIKPLFDASCVKCHGEQKPKGDLRLDTLEGVLKGSEEGKVLVVGDSAQSKIVTAIARINPKTAMPPEPRAPRPRPGASGNPGGDGAGAPPAAAPGGQGGRPQGPPPKPLTPDEVGLVRAWIDQGAK